MSTLPSGTVTFLFTDIEGSTKLAQQYPDMMPVLLARHNEILTCAIETYNSFIFQVVGDSFAASFHNASDALNAALQAQRDLQHEAWSPAPIKVRMGIHTGTAQLHIDSKDNKYSGYATLALTQRVMSAGHGGQILLSNVTENLLCDSLPKDVFLCDMGEHKFKDVLHPVRIFQVVAPSLQSEFPALTTQDIHPNNLPAQLTNFVGREKELTEIAEALVQNRLVTLIGSGGTGKTRLVIEAGAAQLNKNYFTNGVYFIALAPLETIESIVPTIASALGFSFYEGGEPRQQLLDYLREKSMLLIMDNFEHLLSGVDIVTDILNTAPKVKILATSRARLNVQGEQLFHLSGMDFPNWEAPQDASEYSAVKLFTQTARRIHLDFKLTSDSLKYITRICRLVEGMPLGILLAASWMEMLAPNEIASEIEKSLDFLETQQRDVPERQHSMRAVFDYSWKLLTPGEQNVFMKASVFRGGFTREAAQQVTSASLRDLMGLVDKSLLQRNLNGRYGIHELLQQYGAEKLSNIPDELEAVRNQHSNFFAEFLHTLEASLHGKDQREVLAEIETEIENIKIGWDWASEHGQVDWLANYLESLLELYDTRSWSQEGVKLISLTVQKLSKERKNDRAIQLLSGRLWMWQGVLSSNFETADNVNQVSQNSLKIFRDLGAQRELAYALSYSVILNSYQSENGNEPFGQESLHIFKELGDQHGITLALMALAYSALLQENYPLAKQRYQSSLTLLRELNDTKEIIRCLNGLGYVCWRMGAYQEAKQYHEESLLLSKMAGDKYGTAEALCELARDVYGLKDYKQTQELFTASLDLYKEIGSVWGIATQLGDLAELMLTVKDYVQAARFAEEARALYATVGFEGHHWELRISGGAALGMRDIKMAKTCLRQSLEHTIKIHRPGYTLITMIEVARLYMMQAKEEYALELLVLIMSHRNSWQMAKDKAAPLITELENKLHPEVVAQAKERGRARDLEKTVQELLDELKE